MAIDKAEDYFLYSYKDGVKERANGRSLENLIKIVRIRSSNNHPKVQGGLDQILILFKTDKKSVSILPNSIRLLDDSGNVVGPDQATKLQIGQSDYIPLTYDKSKKEVAELLTNKDLQNKQIQEFVDYLNTSKTKGWSVIQDPWDPNTTPPENIPPTTTTTTTVNSANTTNNSTTGTQSKINSDYTFNVEKDNTFTIIGSSLNLGDLVIVRKEDPNNPYFLAPSEGTEEELDEEYSEASYAGPEEDPEILKFIEESASGMPPGNFSANISESDVDNNTPNAVDNVIKKASISIKPGKEFGAVGKVMKDADILAAMVNFIEGGYFSPAHVSKFNPKSKSLYSSSGETLWGIDRCAGQTEKEEVGRKFWAAVDAISGYGDIGSYSRKTNSGNWDIQTYPIRTNAWKYGYMPKPSDKGYDIMYSGFVDYAVNHLNDWLNKYFSTHPELKKMILSDARFKFMWFRSTWNGIGWFGWYANGKPKKGIKGLKWAYDNVSKDLETLIKWDLNNRLVIANGNHLINHDVEKISSIIGIKSLS
jgi:hypothetical protein